jgi:ATP phosphoribosyltransferase regulatory subunit
MVYQPPVGARDLLPLDVLQKHWIEERLQQVFHRWGYHRMITSTLERMDTLMAGDAIQRSTVIQLQGIENEELGLRPELTASIARAAVTRMAGVNHPLRLYCNANVFRRASRNTPTSQQEFYQADVELIGTGGVIADAEILLLLSDCIQALGLAQWHIILGNAGLTQLLLSSFPEPLRPTVRQAIASLDRIALENLPLSADLREQALLLFDLRGQPATVLQHVAKLDLNAQQQETVNDLKSLIELVQDVFNQRSGPSAPAVVLDLSLIQSFDYYTGIVFEVVGSSATGQRVLGQGGRYDQLLGLYHPQGKTFPGVGFVLDIEALHQILLSTGQLPLTTPASTWLIVPTSLQAYPAAFSYAQKIRESTNLVRVEINLEADKTADGLREYARSRRISQIAWVNQEGIPEIETIG